jgi:hypothetical protein
MCDGTGRFGGCSLQDFTSYTVSDQTGQQLEKSELPNPTTTQAIVDEGHFIAKSFIAEKRISQ